jgi:hypothetical protein
LLFCVCSCVCVCVCVLSFIGLGIKIGGRPTPNYNNEPCLCLFFGFLLYLAVSAYIRFPDSISILEIALEAFKMVIAENLEMSNDNF